MTIDANTDISTLSDEEIEAVSLSEIDSISPESSEDSEDVVEDDTTQQDTDTPITPSESPQGVEETLQGNEPVEEVTGSDKGEPEPTNITETETLDFYNAVTKPMKANGKEISISSADDVVRLMQMGLGYSKNMAALKPHTQIIKTLEKNELLDLDKLSFLIDLNEKNPEAISKLLKDGGIDPLELDADDTESYQPVDRSVSKEEIALNDVLEELQTSPNYNEVLDIAGTVWDEDSRIKISNEPSILRGLVGNAENGLFQQINDIVEQERLLNRLTAETDLEAYTTVFDALVEQGMIQKSGTPPSNTGSNNDRKAVAPQSKADSIKNKKNRASTPRGNVQSSSKGIANLDLSTISDDDLDKISIASLN